MVQREMRIAHIINPVKVTEERDLHWQQPIVLESLTEAKGYANSHGIVVEPVTAFYPEDEELCVGFMKAEPLERSVLDIQDFAIPKKLPLFKDILQGLYDTSTADYFVYTNADICVMPHFYMFIKDMIEKGHDSFAINKRIIPETLKNEPLSMMWSNLGTPHAGFDCFVFRRELFPLFRLGNSCVGAPWGECNIVTNLIAFAKNFTVFREQHVTFGIGDRRGWLPHAFNDYRIHCTNEYARMLRRLSSRNRKILKHDITKYLLGKLKSEVTGYSNETYSEHCHYFVNRM